MAGGVAGAAAASLVTGRNFGDTLIASLPSIIGNTVGEMLGERIAGVGRGSEAAKGVQTASGGQYDSRGRPIETLSDHGDGEILVTAPKLGFFGRIHRSLAPVDKVFSGLFNGSGGSLFDTSGIAMAIGRVTNRPAHVIGGPQGIVLSNRGVMIGGPRGVVATRDGLMVGGRSGVIAAPDGTIAIGGSRGLVVTGNTVMVGGARGVVLGANDISIGGVSSRTALGSVVGNLTGSIGAPIAAETGPITQSIGDFRSLGLKDAHHVIQDAAVRDLPGYNTRLAPGVQLQGPSTLEGSPHYNATQAQRVSGGGTYGAERQIAYDALRAAGYTDAQATQVLREADTYFNSIGVTENTPTRIPGNRPR